LPQLTWIGLSVDGYTIGKLIAEGAYSWVYEGTDTSGERRAFKVAKMPEYVQRSGAQFAATARGVFTGGAMEIEPNPRALLRSQHAKLTAAQDASLITVGSLFDQGGLTYYDMELFEGPTLRQARQSGPLSMQAFVDVAEAMARLSKQSPFATHGDLKPDNILLAGDRVILIDPGYFGPIESRQGPFFRAAVTTSIYYPLLRPDDLFAFGLMLWELVCGKHPLTIAAGDTASEPEDEVPTGSHIAPHRELVRYVRRLGRTGNSNLDCLPALPRPAAMREGLNPVLEHVILKLMRLRVKRDRLEIGEGCASFDVLAAGLRKVISRGTTEI